MMILHGLASPLSLGYVCGSLFCMPQSATATAAGKEIGTLVVQLLKPVGALSSYPRADARIDPELAESVNRTIQFYAVTPKPVKGVETMESISANYSAILTMLRGFAANGQPSAAARQVAEGLANKLAADEAAARRARAVRRATEADASAQEQAANALVEQEAVAAEAAARVAAAGSAAAAAAVAAAAAKKRKLKIWGGVGAGILAIGAAVFASKHGS